MSGLEAKESITEGPATLLHDQLYEPASFLTDPPLSVSLQI